MPAVRLINRRQGLLFLEEAGCNPHKAEIILFLQDVHYCCHITCVQIGKRQTDRYHGLVKDGEKL